MKKKTRKKRRKFAEYLINRELYVKKEDEYTHSFSIPFAILKDGSEIRRTSEDLFTIPEKENPQSLSVARLFAIIRELKKENKAIKTENSILKEQISDLNIINNRKRLQLDSLSKKCATLTAENQNLKDSLNDFIYDNL